ncbi:MAG: hypothetical protein AAGF11_31775 [Myxococcota bacterium]
MNPRPLVPTLVSTLISTLVLPGLCLLALACNGDDASPEQRVERLVDDAVTELRAQVSVECDCWADFGHTSRSNCENNALAIGPSEVRCTKEAYAQEPDIALDYLNCVVPLEREYTTCINQRLDCSDPNSQDPCLDDYRIGMDSCIVLPPTITRDLDICTE